MSGEADATGGAVEPRPGSERAGPEDLMDAEVAPPAAGAEGVLSESVAAQWYVYVLLSKKGRTYVGVTTDPDRRLEQHNGELPGGARATRAGRPWRRAALRGPLADRAEAQRIEHRLKKKRGRARIAALAEIRSTN